MERYGQRLLSPEWGDEGRRLAAMAAVCDPETTALLGRLGLKSSWRCLEIGAGGGSIAAWLADRTAHVTATDVDTRYLDGLAAPNLQVLRHDVTADPLPEGAFDLVHARFVLEHLRERDRVLDRMVSWLAPGGLLVVESFARFPLASARPSALRDAMAALIEVLRQTIGTDTDWPRSFPAPLAGRGLTELGTYAHLPVTGGANVSADCWALTLAQTRPRILELGLADAETLDRAQELLADPAFFDFVTATVACWGRRPAATGS